MTLRGIPRLVEPLIRCGIGAISVAILLAFAGTVQAQVPCNADSVITAFERKAQSYRTFRVKYRKEARSLLFGERKPEEGTIWVRPPKSYRIETAAQTVVRGTDTLWAYTPANNQVTLRVGNLDSLEFGPAGFFGSLRHDFLAVDCRVDSLGKATTWKVRLAAKTETAAIQRLTLWIDTTSRWAIQAEYVDYNEETARLSFTDYRTDMPADRERFVFDYPRGVERIVLPTVVARPRTPDGGE